MIIITFNVYITWREIRLYQAFLIDFGGVAFFNSGNRIDRECNPSPFPESGVYVDPDKTTILMIKNQRDRPHGNVEFTMVLQGFAETMTR